MKQIHGSLEATTLWVWYDLVTGVGSDHDRIKNEATTQRMKTIGPDQSESEKPIFEWVKMHELGDYHDIS
jgi:hypothetical protein